MAYRDWFCEDVLSGAITIDKVWEDKRVLAFHHPRPKSPIHVVVIPKAHVPSLLDPLALDKKLLLSMLTGVQQAAHATGLDRQGFFLRVNAAAPGVTPHLHWHVRGPGLEEEANGKEKIRKPKKNKPSR
jgi:histidine triad (HIT) family protein